MALTFEQFRYGFGNAVSQDEARQLYEQYHVAGSGIPIFQAAFANFNPRTEARADKKNPDRGPMLIIGGEKDHQVPWAIANATYKEQSENPASPKSLRSPPRALAHHRQRMARSSPDLPGLHPAIRLSRQLPAATTLNSAEHAEQQPPAHDALQRCPGRHDLYALDQRDGTQVRLTGQGPARSAADQPQPPSAADPGPALPALTETTPI